MGDYSIMMKYLRSGLLLHSLFDSYSNSYSCTYHRVVTHTQEAHHFYVSRYR